MKGYRILLVKGILVNELNIWRCWKNASRSYFWKQWKKMLLNFWL